VTEPDAEYGDTLVRLALEIDRVMRQHAPAGWKGDQARESQVLNALFPLLDRSCRHAGALRTRQEPAGLRMSETIELGDIVIAVTRMDVKHVYLSVHPPVGRVTLVAPRATRMDAARAYAI